MEEEADGTIMLRPDRRRLPRWGSLAALPLVIIGAVRVLLLGWVGVAILAVTIVLVAGLALLIRWLRADGSYARLTPSTLTVKPWYGRPRSVPREAVSRVVTVTVDFGRYSSNPDMLRLLFLGGDNRCLAALNCLGIAPADVAAFAGHLHVPFEGGWERMRPVAVRRAYPGSLSALYAHQVAFGLGIALVIVVLVTGGVIGWAALTGQLGPPKPVALGVTQPALDSQHAHFADVTVIGVDDPATVSVPASAALPGTHFAGVRVRVRSTGSAVVVSPGTDVVVRDSKGDAFSVDAISDPAAAALNTGSDVERGASATAYVVVRVPDTATLTRVEFDDTGSANDRLTWILPPRPPPPTPPPLAPGRAVSLGSENVTVLAVDDPGRGARSAVAVPPGDRLVGVEVRIANTGTLDLDPPYQPLSVVDSSGGRNDGVDISATADAGTAAVKPGQTVTATVYFDVPTGARVVEVEYSYSPPGMGSDAAVAWAAS